MFTVDTTTLNGQAANLDFQLTGDASGTLADDLTLDNDSGYNDAFQPVNPGTSVTFLATLSGEGVASPASPGSSFGFSIL